MEENLCCTIKNSELNTPKEKRRFLTYPSAGLCPCRLEETEDGVNLHFETIGLMPATELKNKSKAEKLRFLIHVAEIEILHREYTFSLAPDNLMVDKSLRAYVLKRDSNCGGDTFFDKYVALIGQIIKSKYSYDDYLNGGKDLFGKKQKFIVELAALESVAQIKERLEEEYDETISETNKTKKTVSKRNVIFSRIFIPLLAVLLLAASFFAVRAIFFEIPYQSRIITASQAYIVGDYLAVQGALRDILPENMSHETRHILARSYVITEPLTDAQKEHILMGLTRMAEGAQFDFWIHLGRLQFDEAIDIAQRFGALDLLLWAYLKQQAFVQADITIPGYERIATLNRLAGEISRLQGELAVEDDQ